MHRFKNILFVADSDADNAFSLQRAVALSQANQATLKVMQVIDVMQTDLPMAIRSITPNEIADILTAEARNNLAELTQQHLSTDQCDIRVFSGQTLSRDHSSGPAGRFRSGHQTCRNGKLNV